jgi:hypothetical protein
MGISGLKTALLGIKRLPALRYGILIIKNACFAVSFVL